MIVVIADDLSGAAELAGLAARRGWTAEVQTVFKPETASEVIAIDTDTRSHSAPRAAQRVQEVAQQVIAARPEWIYKKTDSVLRGQIRAEVTALLADLGASRALLIPANPSRGRVIQSGRYFVGGLPLDQTVFASDPEYPATTPLVVALLTRDDGAEVHWVGTSDEFPPRGIIVPDVATVAELQRRATAVDRATLCAGAAEFFDALLTARSRSTRMGGRGSSGALKATGATLLVCGSAAGWPTRRRECEVGGIPFVELYPGVSDAGRSGAATLPEAGLPENLESFPETQVMAIGSPRESEARSPLRLLDELTARVKHALRERPVARLFLEGGATAAAVLRAMNWTQLEVTGHFAPDPAAFRPVGESGPLIGIKPGSYVWPKTVWP